MNKQETYLSVSEVRSNYHSFFEQVRHIYNHFFLKNEQSTKVEDVKRYGDELFKNNCIDEYFHILIEKSIQNFSMLLAGELSKVGKNDLQKILSNLNQWAELAIEDGILEIDALIREKD